MLNMLEVRLIIDNITRYGGFREKDVLKNLAKIEIVSDNDDYKVYEFMNYDGKYFEYDFKSHKIVG